MYMKKKIQIAGQMWEELILIKVGQHMLISIARVYADIDNIEDAESVIDQIYGEELEKNN